MGWVTADKESFPFFLRVQLAAFFNINIAFSARSVIYWWRVNGPLPPPMARLRVPYHITAQNAACCAFASSGLWGGQRLLQAKFTSSVSPHPASVVPNGGLARPQRQPGPDLDFKVAPSPKWGAPPPRHSSALIYVWLPADRLRRAEASTDGYGFWR